MLSQPTYLLTVALTTGAWCLVVAVELHRSVTGFGSYPIDIEDAGYIPKLRYTIQDRLDLRAILVYNALILTVVNVLAVVVVTGVYYLVIGMFG